MATTQAPAVMTDRELLQRMLLIRRAEEQVIHFATDRKDLIRGHYHVYIGQEATGVGASAALRSDDYVFTTHRNHGHVLARGGEPGPVLAEIIGRSGGYNGGRGGTFHVIAPHLGILHTSAIVGGCLPLAAGAGFSIKKRGTDQVSVPMFGDGQMEEGAFYEAINLASLWKLPVVFLCENNSVPPEARSAGDVPSSSLAAKQLTDIPAALGVPTTIVDGADVRAVRTMMANEVERCRRGEGPRFVEARISRWPGNMAGFPHLTRDYDLAWAFSPESAPAELQDWLRRSDPVALFLRALTSEGSLSKAEVEAIDKEASVAAEQAAKFALDSPPPKPEAAFEHIFA